MTLFGCDISHHNGPGLARMARQPGFVIHKATQGVTFIDDQFAKRNRYLMSNGGTLVRGAYHFLEAQRWQIYGGTGREDRGVKYSGAKQAEFFIKVVKAANGGTLDGVLMALDIERLNFTSIRRRSMPEWRDVKGFIDRFRALTKQPLFIYTTVSWWRRFGNPSLKQWTDVYVWLASWSCYNRIGSGGSDCGQVNKSHMPKANVQPSWWTEGGFGGRKPLIRQWTNNARLGDTRIDCNATPLTQTELRRYANGHTAPGDGGTDPPDGGDTGGGGTDPEGPDGNVWDEAWLDDQTGEVSPEKVTLGAAGGAGILVGGMLLIAGILFVAFNISRNKGQSIFAWQKEAMGAD